MRILGMLLVSMLLLTGCLGPSAPTFEVTGIIETSDGEPIEGVTILTTGAGVLSSNANGEWRITLSRETRLTPRSDEWIFQPTSVTVSGPTHVVFTATKGDPAAISFVSGEATISKFTDPFTEPPTYYTRYHLDLVLANAGDWAAEVTLTYYGDGEALGSQTVEVPPNQSDFEWRPTMTFTSTSPDEHDYGTLSVELSGEAVVSSGPFIIDLK